LIENAMATVRATFKDHYPADLIEDWSLPKDPKMYVACPRVIFMRELKSPHGLFIGGTTLTFSCFGNDVFDPTITGLYWSARRAILDKIHGPSYQKAITKLWKDARGKREIVGLHTGTKGQALDVITLEDKGGCFKCATLYNFTGHHPPSSQQTHELYSCGEDSSEGKEKALEKGLLLAVGSREVGS
jgi:hypothetical protein